MEAARLYGQIAMIFGDIVVTEERLPGNRMHIQRMDEAHELRQIADRVILVLTLQWVDEGNINAAVAVLDVEHHRISTRVMPAADEFDAFGAAGSGSRQVDRSNLSIFGVGPVF